MKREILLKTVLFMTLDTVIFRQESEDYPGYSPRVEQNRE